MKSLYLFVAVLVLALFIAPLTSSSVMADQNLANAGQELKDSSLAKGLCADNVEDRTAEMAVSESADSYDVSDLSGPSRPPVYVTCSSSEWCCKHDFSTGQCSSCCTK